MDDPYPDIVAAADMHEASHCPLARAAYRELIRDIYRDMKIWERLREDEMQARDKQARVVRTMPGKAHGKQ